MQLAHDNRVSGHFAFQKTLHRLDKFQWKNQTYNVKSYCAGCLVCQQQNDNRTKPFGDPQPIPFPDRRWGSIAMDFITHLPQTFNNFNSITTVVDRFSRRIHLMASKDSDSAIDTANTFVREIFILHGIPNSITSDRDPKCTSAFWTRLMELCDVKLRLSSSHYPQSDG